MIDTTEQAAPFLKWVGGKTRLLSQLRPLLPDNAHRMRHFELFLGGGALFFSQQPKDAVLSDANEQLIDTYKAVRDDVCSVINILKMLKIAHNEENYYSVRDEFNRSNAPKPTLLLTDYGRAARFIYLNKTCFNGVYRVNKKNEFNVPFGRYTNPKICDEDVLRAASRALRRVALRCEGFENVLKRANPGDFVYFDPPYDALTLTANFASYTQQGFDRVQQANLRAVWGELDRRRCNLMLSNNATPFIQELYSGYQQDRVRVSRSINSNIKKRGLVEELVVRNY